MKASRYNVVVDAGGEGTRLLFNARSAALAEIDADSWPVLQALLADPTSAATPPQRELLDQLVYGRYVIADEIDEIQALKVESRRQRYAGSTLFLTIAPTLACNFACSYCFEGKGASGTGRARLRMDRKTEDAVLAFAARRLERADRLMVTWFGGEPTLCMKTIERLQPALAALTEERGLELVMPSIVTNGYLLDARVASRLKDLGVLDAQVTLDGPARIHDARRPLRNGGPTFDRILRNLAEASAVLHVVVRVNVDTDNVAAAGEVLHALHAAGVLPRVQVYFAAVNPAPGACADMRGRCLASDAFAREQVSLYRQLLQQGFARVDYPDPSAGSHCSADSENGFAVAPNGLLFKCWEELSLEATASVGSVLDPEPQPFQQANRDRWLAWDAFEKSECVGCSVLPLCSGGCPLAGMRLASSTRGHCCSWKHNLDEMLRLRFQCQSRKEVDS